MELERGYVDADYLSAAVRLFAPIKSRSYERLELAESARVLDLGCGPGLDTVELARRLGARGRVDGLDHDPDMIRQADQRARTAGVAERVHHHRGDAGALPFASGCFDAARAERVFMHLEQPDVALGELCRVVRPDGRISVCETDWASLSCDCSDVDTERRVARFRAERGLNNGYAARGLYGLFKSRRLRDLAVDVFALHVTGYPIWRFLSRQDAVVEQAVQAGALDPQAARAWQDDLLDRDAGGRFFGSVSVVMLSATNAADRIAEGA